MPLTRFIRQSQPLIKPKHDHADKEQSLDAITNSSFLMVALFLIGLLIALNLIFRFPDFGAVIAEYNQF
jgi:hypothetical protein